MNIENDWGITFSPNKLAKVRLFCFPYAGGGASVFAKWHQRLPRDIEVVAVQLPGRESRFHEKPLTDMASVIEGLTALVENKADKPFVFFGHSLGALLSYELSHALLGMGLTLPSHIFVSGKRAPNMPSRRKPIYNLSDSELLHELEKYNGTPSVVLENKELMPLVLPRLRADTQLFDCYRYRQKGKLPCPITAFGGDADPYVNKEELLNWKLETNGDFNFHIFPGNHFFILDQQEQVFAKLLSGMLQILQRENLLPIYA